MVDFLIKDTRLNINRQHYYKNTGFHHAYKK